MSGLAQCGARPLVPVVGDEDGLRLVATREHDVLAEQSDLRNDLGEVVPDLGHSHALFGGRSHALRIHTRPTSKSVALYNSGVNETPVVRPFNRHVDPSKICHHFQRFDLDCDEYDQLRKRAAGRCEICKTPEEDTTRGRLIIEHYHHGDLWFVRGLVCDKCNRVMASHDRSIAWGPATRPHAERAAEFHRNAWGATPEEIEQASQDIAERTPWTRRLGGYRPDLDGLTPP